jgi:hypothetical protein
MEDRRVVAPREGKAQVFKVTSVLWTLGAYKALSNVEENPKDWKKYGLGEKARAIILSGPDGELARLTIGDPVPGKPDTFYVRGTKPVVVEVDVPVVSNYEEDRPGARSISRTASATRRKSKRGR